MNGSEVCTPSNRNAARYKKYKTARVSSYSQTGAPARKRRDEHPHGVGVPTGGSQIGRQRYRGRRERNSALQDVEIGLPVPKGECGKE